MRRTRGRVIPLVLLVALEGALGSLALGQFGVDPPDYYDGDGDDAGHVERIFSQWVDAGVTKAGLTFIPSAPRRCLGPARAPRPPQIAREPLGSRAPPA
jgi:hypothetical protein